MIAPRITIYEAYNHMNDLRFGTFYTDEEGLRQMDDGNSFYIWAKRDARDNDISIRLHEKDLSVDSNGDVYCVDGLDVLILA